MPKFEELRKLLSSEQYPWDVNLSFGQNIVHLFKDFFVIPHANIQIPILAAYASLPSALCTVAPILWIEGSEGSGKSNLLVVFSAVYGVKCQNASWSFASIRNEIEMNRVGSAGEENHFCLCVDNLNESTLYDEKLYTLFLSGYDRKDSISAIATLNGENLEFDTFCPKAVTTVHGLLSLPRFAEIKRRCIRIHTKAIDSISQLDKPNEIDLENFQDIKSLSLEVLNTQFHELWNDSNLGKFLALWKQLSRTKFSCSIPRKKLCLDLTVAGIVSGVWTTPREAVDAIGQYWEWIDDNESESPLMAVIKSFIAEESTTFINLGIEPELNPKKLKAAVLFAASEGLLDCIPSDKAIFQTMASLGWKQTGVDNSTRRWKKT